MKAIAILLALLLTLTGCGADNKHQNNAEVEALQSEIEELKTEIETLKLENTSLKQENAVLKGDATAEMNTTTVSSGYPDPTVYDEFVVELTEDNIFDYVDYIFVVNPDYLDEMYTIIPISKAYDNGWILRDESEDFSIVFENPDPNTTDYKYIHGTNRLYTAGFPDYSTKDSENLPKILKVSGRVRFDSLNSVLSYEWDDYNSERKGTFKDGKKFRNSFRTMYNDYPY